MFTHSCLGGTFDHLHAGHRALLFAAFSQSKHVLVGLTTDAFVQKQNKTLSQNIQPYKVRKQNLVKLLKMQGWLNQATVFPLSDSFGCTVPSAKAGDIPQKLEAIFVSQESKAGALTVNKKRAEFGLSELTVVTIPQVEEGGYIMSSSIIRAQLAKPQGKVFNTEVGGGNALLSTIHTHLQTYKNAKLIAIGDATSSWATTSGLTPNVVVTDGRIGRKPVEDLTFENRALVRATNPPGCVTREATSAVAKSLGENRLVHLCVTGEEDLLVLPFVQQLTPGDIILYGQPQKGIVLCVVSKKLQKEVKSTLQLLL